MTQTKLTAIGWNYPVGVGVTYYFTKEECGEQDPQSYIGDLFCKTWEKHTGGSYEKTGGWELWLCAIADGWVNTVNDGSTGSRENCTAGVNDPDWHGFGEDEDTNEEEDEE
jgi:hypothetical protein